ncbi:hypothetical protein ASC72_17950 [Flavobacterium sp. Root420]|nr:hypothetical protein ASC72_17950 [Flavobacterium sp. Root420]
MLLFASLIYYLINDPNGYGKRTVGIYLINQYSSDSKKIELIKDLTLKLKEDGTYEFSKRLPFIDQKGKWLLEENGLVINILLMNENGTKDKISICCDENNEITFYCYLDRSGDYKRIIFTRVTE